jgi:hypothetical protein
MRFAERIEPIIHDTSETEPRIDADAVAAALGSETCESIAAGLGPVSLLAVRQELFRRLQSTGGPADLEGASRWVKVPVSDEQWQRLEELAAEVSQSGFAPSAGQVATVLLSLSLEAATAKPAGKTANRKPS